MRNPSDAAAWMAKELREKGLLYQSEAAYGLQQTFGDAFVYVNRNGNLAIRKEVLKAFRDLTEGEVVWDRVERSWRYRQQYDPSKGRRV